MSLPETQKTQAALEQLLARYGTDNSDHPMTSILQEGQTVAYTPKRRGGWRSRARD